MASKKVRVDFTGVENFQRPSEGQHVVKIVSAEVKQSQGGNDMIVVAFEVTKGQDKGSRVYENYPLAENALWKLKGMLQAIGMKCDGKVQLDLDKLIGKVCIVEVADDEYEGKPRSRVQECRKLAATAEKEDDEDQDEDEVDDEEDEDEEEEPAPKKSSKKKAAKEPAKKSSKKAPINPPEDEDEDDDWDEDDEEEEDEEPAPKKKASKKPAPSKKPAKKAPAKKKSEPDDDDDDDDDDWDEED